MASTDEQEINYALVAQQIGGLTSSTQEQILTATKTYRNLFEGSVTQFPPTLVATINAFRKIYHKRDWQGFLANHQEALFKSNAKVISCTSDEYPPLLKQISRAPRLLYVRGSVTNLHLPQIAIVGSRQMTRSGQQNALTWSRFLQTVVLLLPVALLLVLMGLPMKVHCRPQLAAQ
jgi:DNA processing protein